MPGINDIMVKLQEFFKKLTLVQKLIIAGVVVAVIVVIIFLTSFSTRTTYSLLYQKPLAPEDYAAVTKMLDDMNVDFQTKDDQFILVKDEKTGALLRMKLGQKGFFPSNIKGWELFDIQKFNTTDFERDINKQRALIGEMVRHLKMLDEIEDVSIQISFPEKKLYSEYSPPVTASVIITPSFGVDLAEKTKENKEKISGIVRLVAKGIPGLQDENVVVVDHNGRVLSDLLIPNELDDTMVLARQQMWLVEKERAQLIAAVTKSLLDANLPKKRFSVSANVELDWTKEFTEGNYIVPITIQEDDPNTPYVEEKITKLGAEVSSKDTAIDFQGPAYIPEGAPGIEGNIPPGLKDKIDKFTHYKENEKIINLTHSTEKVKKTKAPYEIKRITVGVLIDGVWEILRNNLGDEIVTNGGKIARVYTPVSDEELKSYKSIVEMAAGINPARKDKVIVEHVPFDHTAEFEKEDQKIRNKVQLRRILLASIVVLILLFIATLIYRALAREFERRRRLREEELARQQQAMREAALRAAEEEAATVELSIEEKARMELLENAINVSRERPDDVARLIRTWLAEE